MVKGGTMKADTKYWTTTIVEIILVAIAFALFTKYMDPLIESFVLWLKGG